MSRVLCVCSPDEADVLRSALETESHDVDLVVSADVGAMARVWTGHLTFAQAQRSGGLRLTGRSDVVRAFPTWLLLSHFAHVARPGAVVASTAE